MTSSRTSDDDLISKWGTIKKYYCLYNYKLCLFWLTPPPSCQDQQIFKIAYFGWPLPLLPIACVGWPMLSALHLHYIFESITLIEQTNAGLPKFVRIDSKRWLNLFKGWERICAGPRPSWRTPSRRWRGRRRSHQARSSWDNWGIRSVSGDGNQFIHKSDSYTRPVVNFTNILRAFLANFFFYQKL